MLKRILLGLGGTPFTDVAIERAVELAKVHGALITGVTIVDIKQLKQVGSVPLGGGIYAEKLREQRLAVTEERIEEAIENFKEKCREFKILTKIDRKKQGTNALFVCPPGLIDFEYGEGSFDKHRQGAIDAGARLEICNLTSLELDLDEPEDLVLMETELRLDEQ